MFIELVVVRVSSRYLIDREDLVLIIVDVQEKLIPLVKNREEVVKNIQKLVKFSKIVGIPLLVTEQYPKGLGPTVREVKSLIPNFNPIEKTSFSCFDSSEFREKLKELERKTLAITGVETHICIAQTALEALKHGYTPYVISDAVSARSRLNHVVGIERMHSCGAIISSTEMFMYEVLRDAGTLEFKKCLPFLKE